MKIWEALLSRIETLDSQTQIQASEADKIEEKTRWIHYQVERW